MQRIEHPCKLALIILAVAAVPTTDGMAGKKDAAKATMTIQILKVGMGKEGHILSLRGEGKLYDIDGWPVKRDGLKDTLSRPDLLRAYPNNQLAR